MSSRTDSRQAGRRRADSGRGDTCLTRWLAGAGEKTSSRVCEASGPSIDRCSRRRAWCPAAGSRGREPSLLVAAARRGRAAASCGGLQAALPEGPAEAGRVARACRQTPAAAPAVTAALPCAHRDVTSGVQTLTRRTAICRRLAPRARGARRPPVPTGLEGGGLCSRGRPAALRRRAAPWCGSGVASETAHRRARGARPPGPGSGRPEARRHAGEAGAPSRRTARPGREPGCIGGLAGADIARCIRDGVAVSSGACRGHTRSAQAVDSRQRRR